MSNYLVFIRARRSFADIDPEEIPELKDSYWAASANTLLAEASSAVVFTSNFPDWVDACEVVQIGFNICACQDEIEEHVDDELVRCAPTPFSELAGHFESVGIEAIPRFGRKMLLVEFEEDADVERSSGEIERRFTAQQVWHGESFRGFCFVDNRSCDEIVSACDHILRRARAYDFLLVEPLRVTKEAAAGLSQLRQWIETGYKSGPGASFGASRGQR